MARSQFTFTFTNAQPGSVVSFDDHVAEHLYAAATGSTKLGRPLVLNSSNSLSVWTDVAVLTATTEDGAGNEISATATVAAPSVTTAEGTPGQNPYSAASLATYAASALQATADAGADTTNGARGDHHHPTTGLQATRGYKTAAYYGITGSRPNASWAGWSAGRLVVVWFDVFSDGMTIDRMGWAKWAVAAAGGVMRLGWYSAGADGEPGALGFEASGAGYPVDATQNVSPVDIAASTTLPKPGVYLAALSQVAAPQAQAVQAQVSFMDQLVNSFSVSPDNRTRYYDGYTSGALPSTLAGVTPTNYISGAPLLVVRKA